MRMKVRIALVILCAGLTAGLTAGRLSPQGKVRSEPYVWKNVKIGGGGFIPGIVFNTKQPGLVYCRTDIGSSYKWDNKARRWIPLTDWCGVSNLFGSESIATDPIDPNRLYIAQGMYLGEPAAIMRSMDQGKTFQVIDVPFRMGGNEFGRSVGERLAIDPGDNNILYFGSRQDGLWTSRDAALTWSKVQSFPVAGSGRGFARGNAVGLSLVIFDPTAVTAGKPARTIYVGSTDPGDAHLYRSTDAGKTWEAVPGQPKEFIPIHGAFDTRGTLYLVYDNGPGPYMVTNGAVWTMNPKSGAWTDITPDKSPNRPPGGYGGIGVDLRHPGTVVAATLNRKIPGGDDEYRIYKSIDGGKTWKDISARTVRDDSATPYVTWIGKPTGDLNKNPGPSLGWWIATLAIDPFDSNHVCYATGTTIWNATDFGNAGSDRDTHWSVWTEGMEETAILDLLSPTAGSHLISAFGDIAGYTHGDLNVSPKVSEMHLHPLFTNTNTLDYAEKNPEIIIRTGTPALHIPDRDVMAYSEDGGRTWKAIAPPKEATAGDRGGFDNWGGATLNADASVFMTLGATPQISRDRGKTWTASAGLPRGVRPVTDRVNPVKLYAVSLGEGKFYRSIDGGATFSAIEVKGLPALRLGGSRPQLKATVGKEEDLWLIEDGLYHSSDGGATFERIPHAPLVTFLGFGKAAPGKDYPALYITSQLDTIPGLYRSDDKGATWVRINDDRHQYGNRFRCITGDPRIYGRVYVGTDGRGILYGDPAP